MIDSMCKQTEEELKELAFNNSKFKVEVIADSSGKFCGNAMVYETVSQAVSAAQDLASRWSLVTEWRIIAV